MRRVAIILCLAAFCMAATFDRPRPCRGKRCPVEETPVASLIPDPGFEQLPSAWTFDPGWARVSTDPHSGGHAAEVEYAGSVVGVAPALTSARANVVPFRRYRLSFWLRADVFADSGTASPGVRVYTQDSQGNRDLIAARQIGQCVAPPCSFPWRNEVTWFTASDPKVRIVVAPDDPFRVAPVQHATIGADDFDLVEDMANLLINPGFENNDAWVLGGEAAYNTAPPLYEGSRNMQLRSRNPGFPVSSQVEQTVDASNFTLGEEVELAWAMLPSVLTAGSWFGVYIDPGTGSYPALGSPDYQVFAGGAYEWSLHSFLFNVDGIGDVRVKFYVTNGLFDTGTNVWRIDATSLETTAMAVRLAERAVDDVTTLLQSDLGTELGLIDTDRADGITLDVPAAGDYYKRPVSGVGNLITVEVFESDIAFSHPTIDATSQRAHYDLPLTVRLTLTNPGNSDAAQMVTRMRRYATGVFNVFNKNPLGTGTAPEIQLIEVDAVRQLWSTDSEDEEYYTKANVTLELRVRCEELQ